MRQALVPHELSPRAPVFGAVVHRLHGLTMGTSWSVGFVASRTHELDAVREIIERELDKVVGQMSTWRDDSDLARFNRAEAGTWRALPLEFFQVLSHALEVAADSGGACDPTAGALVDLWGFGPGPRFDEAGFMPPGAAAIETAMRRCGWQRVTLDPRGRRALQPGGVRLDLSAVAKGYAVDLVAQRLQERGIESCLVEIGGELRGVGVKPDGQPWWVALEAPPMPDASPMSSDAGGQASDMVVALHGLSIATSGDYRRFFHRDGRRFAHTIDPRSGRPVEHDIASVTVLHRDCMAADSLSTALTVLGPDAGWSFACDRRLAARFVMRRKGGFAMRMTPAFEAMLK